MQSMSVKFHKLFKEQYAHGEYQTSMNVYVLLEWGQMRKGIIKCCVRLWISLSIQLNVLYAIAMGWRYVNLPAYIRQAELEQLCMLHTSITFQQRQTKNKQKTVMTTSDSNRPIRFNKILNVVNLLHHSLHVNFCKYITIRALLIRPEITITAFMIILPQSQRITISYIICDMHIQHIPSPYNSIESELSIKRSEWRNGEKRNDDINPKYNI